MGIRWSVSSTLDLLHEVVLALLIDQKLRNRVSMKV